MVTFDLYNEGFFLDEDYFSDREWGRLLGEEENWEKYNDSLVPLTTLYTGRVDHYDPDDWDEPFYSDYDYPDPVDIFPDDYSDPGDLGDY
jgi:hypothetical protein